MLQKLLICITLLFFSIRSFSQDPIFSQFYANSLYLAPSFVGATQDYRLSFNYRNQWPLISNIYNTYSFSFDKNFSNFNSGLGILATHDVAGSGDLSTTNIGLLYSYDFNISDYWHIRPGVNFKFRFLGIDITKLTFVHQIIGSTPSSHPPPFDNVADIDFATSVIAYNQNIWGGITFDHLLQPEQSFYNYESKLPIKVNLFGGIQLNKRNRLISNDVYTNNVTIAVNFQKQGKFYQTDVGAYYNMDRFIFGLWYRGIPLLTSQPGDAIIGLFGVKTTQFSIGYSYDFTISDLKFATSGSHEVSLVYEFTFSNYNRKIRVKALPCPIF